MVPLSWVLSRQIPAAEGCSLGADPRPMRPVQAVGQSLIPRPLLGWHSPPPSGWDRGLTLLEEPRHGVGCREGLCHSGDGDRG